MANFKIHTWRFCPAMRGFGDLVAKYGGHFYE